MCVCVWGGGEGGGRKAGGTVFCDNKSQGIRNAFRPRRDNGTRASFVIGGAAHTHTDLSVYSRVYFARVVRGVESGDHLSTLSSLARDRRGEHPGTRGAHALRSRTYGARARAPRRKGVRVSCKGRRHRRRRRSSFVAAGNCAVDTIATAERSPFSHAPHCAEGPGVERIIHFYGSVRHPFASSARRRGARRPIVIGRPLSR